MTEVAFCLLQMLAAEIGTQPKVGRSAGAGPHLGVDRTQSGHVGRASFSSVHDPDCVKTCTHQNPLESYSNTPPNHPRLEHSSTKARRESCAPEEQEPRSFREFCTSASVGAKRRASRERDRTSDA